MNTVPSPLLPTSFTFERTFQGIDEFVLSNGLRVLLFLDMSQANVTVNITYLVGSRHEGRGEAGMAHLLEHMLFRGTKEVRDVKGALQDRGAQFNATTWFDRTNYFETLTPTIENLSFALKLEADRMINSTILQEDLDAEMTVVRNEFEMGENNPVHVLHDQIMSSAYRWHNYGKTTIGNRSDIERVPVEKLRRFYEHYYQPDNAVLIVAGQFSKETAIELIDKYFSVLKRPTRILDETYTEEPAQDGPREIDLFRVGDMASIGIGYHIPAASHEDHAPLRVLFDAITDEPSGIIYEKLVKTGACSEVFSMTYALYEPGMALCFVRPTDDSKVFIVRDELISLIEEQALGSLTNTQVERIKTRILKRIKLSMANSKDLALKLSESIACGDWRLFFWYRDQIKDVAQEDVMRVFNKYILPSNRTVGIFIPDKNPQRVTIEKAQNIASIVANIAEDTSLSMGEAFVAHANNIEKLVTRKELDALEKIAILMKKTRGELVRSQIKFRFANESALLPYVKEFWLIPSLLLRGTSKFDYQGLRDKVDTLMSTLDIDGHAGVLTASIKSERVYLLEMMSLFAHICEDSLFSKEEFDIVKQREIDNYEEIRSDPQRIGFLELERLRNPWPKSSILYIHSFDEIIESIKELSSKKVKDAYLQLFSPNNFTISVVGDCDSDTLLDNVPALFKRKAIDIPYERIKRPFIENLVEDITIDTKDKEMAIVAYAFNFPMRDDHEDYACLKLANYMFGENMNSRLINRIREKEGISYGAGSSIEISRYEESASFILYAMSAPDSVTRAKRAIEEEWMKFINEGISENELKNAKESIWLTFENMLGNDGFLVSALAYDLEVGRNFLWRENLYKRMNNLTVSDINSRLLKWWSNKEFSKVTAVDKDKMR